MKTDTIMKYVSIVSVIAAVAMFAYVVDASNMTSYLSSEPKVCINCHTMNTQYATWQHSSHRSRATCVDCHLPTESLFEKMLAKSRDGFNHSVAMTFHTYGDTIRASQDAKKRIQANCIRCHKEMVSEITAANALYQKSSDDWQNVRQCWSCHRSLPHGRVRALTATPDAIGVKEI